MTVALITGVTGQDGSYLAELLLDKGYAVHGMVRRSSTETFERIAHLRDRISLHQADLNDLASLVEVVQVVRPTEVYNLAAQSFVPTSWKQPLLTADVTAMGVTRVLEAIRLVNPKGIRFYQASSSEMFGKVRATPQDEQTPFYPRSPYGVAKVYGHFITVNYRESYGMYCVSGILFNHECLTAETPVFVRRNGLIDLLPIEDVVPHRTDPKHGVRYSTVPSAEDRLEIWDSNGWVGVTCLTANWVGPTRGLRRAVHRVTARGAHYRATADHTVFVRDGEQVKEVPAAQVRAGDRLPLVQLPEPTNAVSLSTAEAWLLGVLAAEGYVSEDGKADFSNQDEALLDKVAAVWQQFTGGTTSRYVAASGYENGRPVTQLRLTGCRGYSRWLRELLYTRAGDKRVPARVLNGDEATRLAFVQGYHEGDGLKAARGTYEFKGFKSASAVLAAGIYWLAHTTLRQRAIICLEERDGRSYYQINLNSPSRVGDKGQHLVRPLEEVVKSGPVEYEGWVFDLATESGTFHAGIGQGWVHNSPRRGREFVTRKVTDAVARIKLGLEKELRIGNLEARRDWGFAGDYVRAMWLMLQQEKPDDYVVASGQSHTVRELIEIAFGHVGLDWRKHTVQAPEYMRPAEVDLLLGDPSKARRVLGWKPEVSFEQLITMMVDADLKRYGAEKCAR